MPVSGRPPAHNERVINTGWRQEDTCGFSRRASITGCSAEKRGEITMQFRRRERCHGAVPSAGWTGIRGTAGSTRAMSSGSLVTMASVSRASPAPNQGIYRVCGPYRRIPPTIAPPMHQVGRANVNPSPPWSQLPGWYCSQSCGCSRPSTAGQQRHSAPNAVSAAPAAPRSRPRSARQCSSRCWRPCWLWAQVSPGWSSPVRSRPGRCGSGCSPPL